MEFIQKPYDKYRLMNLQLRTARELYTHVPDGLTWMDTELMQWPIDLMYYQYLITKIKPNVFIETGTAGGGNTLFINDIYSLLKLKGLIDFEPTIITVDIKDSDNTFPSTIEFIEGSSVSKRVLNRIMSKITSDDIVMVTLDSAHNFDHVLCEMDHYSKMVTVGSYMIVQDTALDLTQVIQKGPMAAIMKFLDNNDKFEIDHSFNRWIFTQHPNGYLRKVK